RPIGTHFASKIGSRLPGPRAEYAGAGGAAKGGSYDSLEGVRGAGPARGRSAGRGGDADVRREGGGRGQEESGGPPPGGRPLRQGGGGLRGRVRALLASLPQADRRGEEGP